MGDGILRDCKSKILLRTGCALVLCAVAGGYLFEHIAQVRHASPPVTALDSAVRRKDDLQLGTALFNSERLDEAFPYLQRVWDARPARPEQESEASLLGESQFGAALFQLGRYDEARPVLAWVLPPLKRMRGMNETTAEVSMALGMILGNARSLQEAEPLLRDAYEFYRPTSIRGTAENAATAARALGQLRYEQRRGAESEALALESLHIVSQLPLGNSANLRFGALYVLGQAYGLEGRFKDADTTLREAMGLLPPGPQSDGSMARSWEALGRVYDRQAKWASARQAYEQALSLRGGLIAQQPWEVAQIQYKLGIALFMLGDYDTAKPLLTRSLHTREQAFGKDHVDTALSAFYLGIVYGSDGSIAEADALVTQALKVFSQNTSIDPAQLAAAKLCLGELRGRQQRPLEARELIQAARDFFETQPLMIRWTLHSAVTLAEVEYLLGNTSRAQTLFLDTHLRLKQSQEADNSDRLMTAILLGKLLRAAGQVTRAARYEKEGTRLCREPNGNPAVRKICTSPDYLESTKFSQPSSQNSRRLR
jgi:tetratricopeptide (TPR) repeat protein